MTKLCRQLRHNELVLKQRLRHLLNYRYGKLRSRQAGLFERELGTNDSPLTSYCHRLTAKSKSTKHISSFRSTKAVHKYAPKLFSLGQLNIYILIYTCIYLHTYISMYLYSPIYHLWICIFINGLVKILS